MKRLLVSPRSSYLLPVIFAHFVRKCPHTLKNQCPVCFCRRGNGGRIYLTTASTVSWRSSPRHAPCWRHWANFVKTPNRNCRVRKALAPVDIDCVDVCFQSVSHNPEISNRLRPAWHKFIAFQRIGKATNTRFHSLVSNLLNYLPSHSKHKSCGH